MQGTLPMLQGMLEKKKIKQVFDLDPKPFNADVLSIEEQELVGELSCIFWLDWETQVYNTRKIDTTWDFS